MTTLDDIPADTLLTLTPDLNRLFDYAHCSPACHACCKAIEIGATFQLVSSEVSEDDVGRDEMLCSTCDRAAVAAARKVSTHTFYAAPTAGQLAGLAALRHGASWLAETREAYRRTGEAAAAALGVPPPAGGTFLFVDVAAHLDDRGIWGFLADCLQDGVALAPGSSCGAGYDSWLRLCFTAAPPEDVARAVERLAARLGR